MESALQIDSSQPIEREDLDVTDEELDQLVEKLDLAQKVRLLAGASVWRTHAEPAIGLRAMVMSDGPIGVRGEGWDERVTALTLPSPTALAATWDDELVYRLGALLAGEARRKGVDVVLAPALNLHRSALAGRHFECYSEDPVLTGRIGAALIRGVQSGGVAATAKHFAANDSETDRMTVDVLADEATLHELYLAPFEAAVDAGVWVVMSAYNAVNGTTMSESPLLTDPLKSRWGFDGLVVSDWGGVRSTVPAARAAQDLAMPGPSPFWGEEDLVSAVESGEVPESAIDDKIRRLLRLASRVGALHPAASPAPHPAARPASTAGDTPRDLLRQTVAASCVLLRNEGGVLPLDPGALRRIAVIGRSAAVPRIQGGGSAGVFPRATVSPLDGIRTALAGLAEVAYAPGVSITDLPTPLDTANARNPRTGEPGLLVRVLDAHGAELHAEHRLTGRLLEPTLTDSAAYVEVSALLQPHVPGEWRLAMAGWGHLHLAADGRTLLDEEIPKHTDDPATVHLHPPYRRAILPLTTDHEIELVARRRLDHDTGRATVLAADPPRPDDDHELAAAAHLAATCDAAIVVIGTTEEIEAEGRDRTCLTLPGRQNDLVTAITAANPRTIVVVNSGGPIAMPWHTQPPALLLTWFPGQEAGHGLADVLFGVHEPGGRLPTTWNDSPITTTTPQNGTLPYREGLNIGYRAWHHRPDTPTYWFGHGLGYTTWSYESLVIDDSRVARVRVRNTGARAGGETVQVYLSRPESAVRRPAIWLAGYARAKAAPGETAEVVIPLPERAFQHWSADHRAWCREPGTFAVHAGPSADVLPLHSQVESALHS
ncbi:glycoside hydrolase family 3 C-terminal domain-containing protein [Acrocarpospora catenulata]|uniref:glycoside hydrolase family 3 C-terminal domain-containing protein n=1 Tax=Acrocarpospora catenulata TaxID=2836182 RepID=UPI002023A47D|nr:glycoside hydrolase family 3 C-terminal domain-containing protein [Acrocarpospora catenulata]